VNFVPEGNVFTIIFPFILWHQRREAVVLIHVEHNWLHQRHYFLVIPIAFNRSCNQLGDGFTVIPEMVTPQ
jgi:hypothetical protein